MGNGLGSHIVKKSTVLVCKKERKAKGRHEALTCIVEFSSHFEYSLILY